jgi:hypothetical protein
MTQRQTGFVDSGWLMDSLVHYPLLPHRPTPHTACVLTKLCVVLRKNKQKILAGLQILGACRDTAVAGHQILPSFPGSCAAAVSLGIDTIIFNFFIKLILIS